MDRKQAAAGERPDDFPTAAAVQRAETLPASAGGAYRRFVLNLRKWREPDERDPFAVAWSSMSKAERAVWLSVAGCDPVNAMYQWPAIPEPVRERVGEYLRRAAKRLQVLVS